MKRTAFTSILALAVAITTGCKKKDDAGGGATADKTAENAGDKQPAAAKPPAAMVDKKLPQVGVTLSLPADAKIDEGKMDMGGFQATISFDGMQNFFVENVGEGADNLERVMKHAEAKEWKSQVKNPDGTWTLEWTKPDMVEPTKTVYGVAVRVKAGDKLVDCNSNGLSADQAATLMKVCASIKP